MVSLTQIILILRTLFVMGIFLFAGNVVAEAGVVDQKLPLQLGDYLSVEYIDYLIQTRSPITAGEKSDQRRYCKVEFDVKDKKLYFGIGNLHDSEALYVTNSTLGNVTKVFGQFPVKLKVFSPSEFSIKVDAKVVRFRYVGNFQIYIARNTVAGKYKDNKGALYTLTEEGLAMFPDRKFRYEVPTDLTMGFDQFYEIPIRDDGIKYGFKVINSELQLFKIVGEFVDKPEPNPFLILTRIDDASAAP